MAPSASIKSLALPAPVPRVELQAGASRHQVKLGRMRQVMLATHGMGVIADTADLVLLEGKTLAEAVVSRRLRPMVMKRGKIVARAGRALFEVE